MRETFPPAIKHLAHDSLSASQQAARTVFASQEPAEDFNQVRDKRLDLTIEAFFKVAVLQARRTESVTDVAALWEETHGFYAERMAMWEPVAVSEPAIHGLINRQAFLRKVSVIDLSARSFGLHPPRSRV